MLANQKKKIYIGGSYPNGAINEITSKTIKEILEENGFEIEEDYKNANIYICNDYTSSARKELRWFPKDKKILLVCEPKVVLPNNFKQKIRNQFGFIVSRHIEDQQYFLQYQQYWNRVVLESDNRIEKLVVINSNKISLIKGNNYGLRKLSSKKLAFVDLYGRDWEMGFSQKIKELLIALKRNVCSKSMIDIKSVFVWLSSNPITQGVVENKSEIMSKYRYALVIENQNTYISEKLFDAFFSGCIPIYIGPKIDDSIIPNSLFVAATPNLSGIENSFIQIQAIDYKKWKTNLRSWLSKKETRLFWDENEVYKILSKRIYEYISKFN